MEGEDYSPSSPLATKIETFTNYQKQLKAPRKKKKKNKNKRRFNDEQIRSLESIFKSEKKLQPRKKLELAREVGLQPRQVAIWFQNKRARWKSKQIEEDYTILKANYDDLYARFESLKNEKQSLLFQLQKLSDLLKQPHDAEGKFKHLSENSSEGGSEFNEKPSCLNEEFNRGAAMYSDDERGNGGYFKHKEEPERTNTGERVDDSLESPGKWCQLDSIGVLDQSCGSSNWWDFWT